MVPFAFEGTERTRIRQPPLSQWLASFRKESIVTKRVPFGELVSFLRKETTDQLTPGVERSVAADVLAVKPTLLTELGLVEALGMVRMRGLHAILHRIKSEVQRAMGEAGSVRSVGYG